jgi:hypothetical protein
MGARCEGHTIGMWLLASGWTCLEYRSGTTASEMSMHCLTAETTSQKLKKTETAYLGDCRLLGCYVVWLFQEETFGTYRLYQTNSVALGPQANYTDWSTATFLRNLVPTFVDSGVSRGQRGGYNTVDNLSFLDRNCYFFSSSSSFNLTRTEWTPFQTHCYSENLVAPGIVPGTSGLVARNCDY